MCRVEGTESRSLVRQLYRELIGLIAFTGAILAVCSATPMPARQIPPGETNMFPPMNQMPVQDMPDRMPNGAKTSHQFKAIVETSPAELARQLPELKHLEPANSQDELPEILSRVGAQLKIFFKNFPNTACTERIASTLETPAQPIPTRFKLFFNYLVLAKGDTTRKLFQEYRTDDRNQLVSLRDTTAVVTTGFASATEYFYPDFQPDSRFLLLGREELKGQDTYVIAFAQRPEVGRSAEVLALGSRREAGFLQGVAWIDAKTYDLVRVRTDILQETGDIDFRRETTEVEYAPVSFKTNNQTFWVPKEVTVFGEFGPYTFHNFHTYSKYRVFKVETEAARNTPDKTKPFHPDKVFVETPPAEIPKQLHELKYLQPAKSQDELPEILGRVGERLKVFFANFPNTTCSERITSIVDAPEDAPLRGAGMHSDLVFNYLVLAKGGTDQKLFQEYRTDQRGRPPDFSDTEGVVTIGFAGAIEDFYPDYQPDSRFRLLGREEVKGQDTYVLALAQRPERGRHAQILASGLQRGTAFLQGLAWIDAKTYDIVRVRTEILQETGDVDLRQETTEVEYAPVSFKGSGQTLLVPKEVTVSGQLGKYSFQNMHRYSNYRIFKVEAEEKPRG